MNLEQIAMTRTRLLGYLLQASAIRKTRFGKEVRKAFEDASHLIGILMENKYWDLWMFSKLVTFDSPIHQFMKYASSTSSQG